MKPQQGTAAHSNPARCASLIVLAAFLTTSCSRDDHHPPSTAPAATTPSAAATAPPSPTTDPAKTLPIGTPPQEWDTSLKAIAGAIKRNEIDRSRERLQLYLEQFPSNAGANFLMGLTYHREKRYHLAKPLFLKAIELDPAYPLSYYFLAWGQYYMGDLPESRLRFEQFLAFQPDEGDGHFGLGLIDFDEDHLDQAEKRFRRAIELLSAKPELARDTAKAHARLADIYLQREELEAARAELVIATTLFPNHYEAHYKLFRVLTRLGETEAAAAAEQAWKDAEQRVRPRTAFPE